jgi:putative selenium metabolism hydrolase
MTMPPINTIRDACDRYSEWVISVLKQLIAVPSLSGKEGQVIEVISNLMRDIGIPQIRVDNFGNIIGTFGIGSPILAFDAHVDTVDTGDLTQWDTDPFQSIVKDGRIYGRGAADQKGGMAAMLLAAKVWQELKLNLPGTVMLIGSVQEEDCDGLCWQYLIERENIKPNAVVLTEPTGMRLNRGQRGRMEIDIETTGMSCHGSEPERGVNAISLLSPVVTEIDQLNARLPEDDFLGKATVAVTEFRSQSPSLCAVPDSARLHLDRRLTMQETPESALEQIRNLPSVQAAHAKVRTCRYTVPSHRGTVFETDMVFPTWVMPEDHYVVRAGVETFRSAYNRDPEISRWRFSTNGVATCGKYGIPSIGFGPGSEDQAHKANESIPISELTEISLFYAILPWIFSDFFRRFSDTTNHSN